MRLGYPPGEHDGGDPEDEDADEESQYAPGQGGRNEARRKTTDNQERSPMLDDTPLDHFAAHLGDRGG